MLGAAAAQAAQERRQQFEAQREKWTEVRDENGKPVEYLMVKCENCGQVWPRQHVLRFNEHELREWQAIENSRFPRKVMVLAMLAPFALFGIGAVAWLMTNSIFYGVVAFAVTTATYFYFTWRRDTRRAKELREMKQCVLAHHGDIPENEVGMVDQYYTDYVILPATQH